jgi:hypothetical protein
MKRLQGLCILTSSGAPALVASIDLVGTGDFYNIHDIM